jgi:hypothetical protein
VSSIGTEENPAPLSDQERKLLHRMFSDYIEVPPEWKASLRADLERDPPILGKITLGSPGSSQVPLEALASSGEIGSSGVEIHLDGITLGGDVVVVRQIAGTLDILAPKLRLGTTSDIVFSRPSAGILALEVDDVRIGTTDQVHLVRGPGGRFEFRTDDLRFGFGSQDVALLRYGIDTIEIPDQLLVTYNAGSGVTPLYLNENGTVYQVRVGPGGSGPGGSGRALYIT